MSARFPMSPCGSLFTGHRSFHRRGLQHSAQVTVNVGSKRVSTTMRANGTLFESHAVRVAIDRIIEVNPRQACGAVHILFAHFRPPLNPTGSSMRNCSYHVKIILLTRSIIREILRSMKKPKESDPKLTVFCRVTPDVRKRLDELASVERRTISQLVLFALERYLEKP